jgi:hypothetical protein
MNEVEGPVGVQVPHSGTNAALPQEVVHLRAPWETLHAPCEPTEIESDDRNIPRQATFQRGGVVSARQERDCRGRFRRGKGNLVANFRL